MRKKSNVKQQRTVIADKSRAIGKKAFYLGCAEADQRKVGQILAVAVLALSVGIVNPATAYTSCVGGTEITRNQYGASGAPATCTAAMCPSETKTFCKSNLTMNWWSAFNWCKSNGGTLASFVSMCPGVTTSPNNETGACPALQGTSNQWVWSSMGYGSSNALTVSLLSGAVNSNVGRNNVNFALCE